MYTRNFYKGLAAMHCPVAPSVPLTVKNYRGDTVNVSTGHSVWATYIGAALGDGAMCKSSKTSTQLIGGNRMYCIAFGDGDAAPTLDDYQLSGNHITAYNATVAWSLNAECDTATATYTISNTGDTAFTIREAGIYLSTSTSYSNFILAWREVLESPVAIAPYGVGQVTLTFKVNRPE